MQTPKIFFYALFGSAPHKSIQIKILTTVRHVLEVKKVVCIAFKEM
jgi:hypothetical protein